MKVISKIILQGNFDSTWMNSVIFIFPSKLIPVLFQVPTEVTEIRDGSLLIVSRLRTGQVENSSTLGSSTGPALGPTQLAVQLVPGHHSSRVKRPTREADHSPI
jgi:hypothetical protein